MRQTTGNTKGNVMNILVALCALGLSGCGQPTESPSGEPAATAESASGPETAKPEGDAVALVRALADDVWQYQIENSTYLRLQEGLPIERFEDLTLEEYHRNLRETAGFRERLERIDPSSLSGDALITYEILAFDLRRTGANDDDYWLSFDITSYQAPYLIRFAEQALNGQAIPDKAAADHYLKLAGELADVLDQMTTKVEGQVERGIYLPRPALPSVRATWAGMQKTLPDAMRVSDERLSALSESERAEFKAALDTLISERVESGFDNLLAALGDGYEAKAPQAVGLGQYRGGAEVYLRAIETQTTLDLSPQAIHERGKKAVNEIAARMADIREQLEFDGTASEFVDQLMTDPRFIAESPAEVEDRYWEYIHRVEPVLDDYFEYRPEAEYGIRRLPPAAEPGMTYGYYSVPTADDPVGYYNYNGSNLEKRSLVWVSSLIYHELLPGHHFHLATQNENDSLQEFRKKYSVAAFTEGWAEYAASLGIEMGMYEDPYDLYGRYIAEIFLASRLVVDTGMNALGWSLEEARDYMARYVVQSEEEIASETLRYATSIPAQALAYRLGYEKHWELRRRAEAKLGDVFDIRDYHNVVLSDGTKPLPVLEAKVDRWIAARLGE